MNCILIKSYPLPIKQQNENSLGLFCSNLAILYELLKWQGVNPSYLRQLPE